MLPGTATTPAAGSVFLPPALLSADREVRARMTPARFRHQSIEHDASLLVAALADVGRQHAALEWLREADLFRACLG